MEYKILKILFTYKISDPLVPSSILINLYALISHWPLKLWETKNLRARRRASSKPRRFSARTSRWSKSRKARSTRFWRATSALSLASAPSCTSKSPRRTALASSCATETAFTWRTPTPTASPSNASYPCTTTPSRMNAAPRPPPEYGRKVVWTSPTSVDERKYRMQRI